MRRKKISKEKIMETALSLMAEKGINNVSMNEIALKLGITKPVLYYYFKNKDEMVKYAFELKSKEIKEIDKDIKGIKNLKKLILALISKHYFFFKNNISDLKCFFRLIESDDKNFLKKIAIEIREENRKKFKKHLANTIHKGKRLSEKQIKEISDFISATIAYIIMEIKIAQIPDLKSIFRLAEIFLKGFKILFLVSLFSTIAYTKEINIDEAIQLAYKNNIGISNAYMAEKIYKEKINEYYGGAYPQISLSASYTKNMEKQSIFFGSKKIEVGLDNAYLLSLDLNQVLWSGGKVDTGIKMAKIYSQISSENSDFVKKSVKKSVKEIFYSLLYARELVKIQKESLNIALQHLKTTQEKFDKGLASDLNVLRQKVEVSNNEPSLIKAENLYESGLLNFKNLLGINIDEELELNGDFNCSIQEQKIDELYAEALLKRADYRLAVLNKEMAEKQLKIEKSNHLPVLSLYATRQFSGQSNNTFPDSNERTWSLNTGLKLSLPIFNGWTTTSKIKQAEYNLKIANNNIEDLKRKIKVEIKQALLNIEEAQKRIESQKTSVENAQKALKATEIRFSNGLASQLELNDASLILNTAKLQQAQALHDYCSAIVNLDYVTGK